MLPRYRAIGQKVNNTHQLLLDHDARKVVSSNGLQCSIPASSSLTLEFSFVKMSSSWVKRATALSLTLSCLMLWMSSKIVLPTRRTRSTLELDQYMEISMGRMLLEYTYRVLALRLIA